MSIINQNLRIVGSKGEMQASVLFDSGASFSFIREDIAKKIGILYPLDEALSVELGQKDNFFQVDSGIGIAFFVDNVRLRDEFFIYSQLSEEVVVGATTMQKYHIKLDFKEGKVIVDPKVMIAM